MASKKTDLAKGFAAGAPGVSHAPLSRRERTFIDSGRAGGGSKMRRADGPDTDRIGSIYLPKVLATDLRVRCAQSRQSLSDAITEAVTMWLSNSKAL